MDNNTTILTNSQVNKNASTDASDNNNDNSSTINAVESTLKRGSDLITILYDKDKCESRLSQTLTDEANCLLQKYSTFIFALLQLQQNNEHVFFLGETYARAIETVFKDDNCDTFPSFNYDINTIYCVGDHTVLKLCTIIRKLISTSTKFAGYTVAVESRTVVISFGKNNHLHILQKPSIQGCMDQIFYPPVQMLYGYDNADSTKMRIVKTRACEYVQTHGICILPSFDFSYRTIQLCRLEESIFPVVIIDEEGSDNYDDMTRHIRSNTCNNECTGDDDNDEYDYDEYNNNINVKHTLSDADQAELEQRMWINVANATHNLSLDFAHPDSIVSAMFYIWHDRYGDKFISKWYTSFKFKDLNKVNDRKNSECIPRTKKIADIDGLPTYEFNVDDQDPILFSLYNLDALSHYKTIHTITYEEDHPDFKEWKKKLDVVVVMDDGDCIFQDEYGGYNHDGTNLDIYPFKPRGIMNIVEKRYYYPVSL